MVLIARNDGNSFVSLCVFRLDLNVDGNSLADSRD
jgi:hypothetical protein